MQKNELLNKKKSAFIRICIFMAVLTIPMLSWGVLKTAGIFTPSLMEKLDFNLNENRNKSEFPDSFNPKTVTSELEAYFNDRVPFRSAIITVNRKIYSAMEKGLSGNR